MISNSDEFHATNKVTKSHSQLVSTALTVRDLGNETLNDDSTKISLSTGAERLSQMDTMYRKNKASLQKQNS